MKDGFYRIDGDDNFIPLIDEELDNLIEEFFSNDHDDDNEELPPPPEEIYIDMSKFE